MPILTKYFRCSIHPPQHHYSFFHAIALFAAMALILNIDTAVQTASICLADGEQALAEALNPTDRAAAGWLHPAIQELMARCGYALQQVDAVAVSAGPGSYTGLRVGMAAAKGLCYALNRPLITINTLQMMAAAAVSNSEALLCPMIDARRMEVFTAVYTRHLQEVIAPHNLILTDMSFHTVLEAHQLLFFGNGSHKAASIINHSNASFVEVTASARHLVCLSHKTYCHSGFADVAYAEPFYGKDFHSPLPKNKY